MFSRTLMTWYLAGILGILSAAWAVYQHVQAEHEKAVHPDKPAPAIVFSGEQRRKFRLP